MAAGVEGVGLLLAGELVVALTMLAAADAARLAAMAAGFTGGVAEADGVAEVDELSLLDDAGIAEADALVEMAESEVEIVAKVESEETPTTSTPKACAEGVLMSVDVEGVATVEEGVELAVTETTEADVDEDALLSCINEAVAVAMLSVVLSVEETEEEGVAVEVDIADEDIIELEVVLESCAKFWTALGSLGTKMRVTVCACSSLRSLPTGAGGALSCSVELLLEVEFCDCIHIGFTAPLFCS